MPPNRGDEDGRQRLGGDWPKDVSRLRAEDGDARLGEHAPIDRKPVLLSRCGLVLDPRSHLGTRVEIELEIGRDRPRACGLRSVDDELQAPGRAAAGRAKESLGGQRPETGGHGAADDRGDVEVARAPPVVAERVGAARVYANKLIAEKLLQAKRDLREVRGLRVVRR